jgi:prepilin-type N-terminal cleavage/methylation domain-containing protein/prepilin-type processing-associated H-X9-DG protein
MLPTTSHFRRYRPAFTLVELLVVIGVIALLISILLPALNRARMHANRVACSSNMRQIGLYMMMYHEEFKSLPIGYHQNEGQWWWSWDKQMGKYLFNSQLRPWQDYNRRAIDARDYPQPRVLQCPSDTMPRPATFDAGGASNTVPVHPRSYSMVAASWAGPGGLSAGTGAAMYNAGIPLIRGPKGVRMTDIRQASETLLLVELAAGNNFLGNTGYASLTNHNDQHRTTVGHGGNITPRLHSTPAADRPWDMSVNYLFADGHVEFLPFMSTLGTNPSTGNPIGLGDWQPRGMWTRAVGD